MRFMPNNVMRQLSAATQVLLCALLAFEAQAQYVTIPDGNFRSSLQALYPACFNGNGQMDTTCAAIVNAIALDVSSENIVNLQGVQYFDNLLVLDCSWNISTAIPALPGNLTRLNCEYSEVDVLPTLPASLTQLYCSVNDLSSLPDLPSGLRILDVKSNHFIHLPTLPASLEELNCSSNTLVDLPALNNNLTILDCRQNQITHLPPLPASLEELICRGNALVDLPALNNGLISLECNQNQITSLPTLPATLESLSCSDNLLTQLPPLNNNLIYLTCNDNALSCLPLLPESLASVYSGNNPINCIPNRPVGCFSCTYYPLCSAPTQICIGNKAFCRGIAFFDANSNGLKDLGEWNFENLVINANPNNYSTCVGDDGYVIALDTQTTSIVQPINPYPLSLYSAPPLYSVTSQGPSLVPGTFDFALKPIANIHDLQVYIASSEVRPGFSTYVNIRVNNFGTVVESPLLKLAFPNDWVVTTSLPQGAVNGDTIQWQDTLLQPFHYSDFYVEFYVPPFVPIGTPFTYNASLPYLGDVTPENNIYFANDTVIGSFDPNDKACNTPLLEPGYSTLTEMIYTIRFQNTGNASAINVMIRDTLSPLLQANSIRVVNYSHDMEMHYTDYERVLSFVFPNINLIDSFTNEPLSHGFVQFAVKPQPGLPLGTDIENFSDIYFDFNEPVRTNTVVTHIDLVGMETPTDVEVLGIAPNPSNGLVRVTIPGLLASGASLTVSNMLGQTVMDLPCSNNVVNFSIADLPSGMYVISVTTQGGSNHRGLVMKQ